MEDIHNNGLSNWTHTLRSICSHPLYPLHNPFQSHLLINSLTIPSTHSPFSLNSPFQATLISSQTSTLPNSILSQPIPQSQPNHPTNQRGLPLYPMTEIPRITNVKDPKAYIHNVGRLTLPTPWNPDLQKTNKIISPYHKQLLSIDNQFNIIACAVGKLFFVGSAQDVINTFYNIEAEPDKYENFSLDWAPESLTQCIPQSASTNNPNKSKDEHIIKVFFTTDHAFFIVVYETFFVGYSMQQVMYAVTNATPLESIIPFITFALPTTQTHTDLINDLFYTPIALHTPIPYFILHTAQKKLHIISLSFDITTRAAKCTDQTAAIAFPTSTTKDISHGNILSLTFDPYYHKALFINSTLSLNEFSINFSIANPSGQFQCSEKFITQIDQIPPQLNESVTPAVKPDPSNEYQYTTITTSPHAIFISASLPFNPNVPKINKQRERHVLAFIYTPSSIPHATATVVNANSKTPQPAIFPDRPKGTLTPLGDVTHDSEALSDRDLKTFTITKTAANFIKTNDPEAPNPIMFRPSVLFHHHVGSQIGPIQPASDCFQFDVFNSSDISWPCFTATTLSDEARALLNVPDASKIVEHLPEGCIDAESSRIMIKTITRFDTAYILSSALCTSTWLSPTVIAWQGRDEQNSWLDDRVHIPDGDEEEDENINYADPERYPRINNPTNLTWSSSEPPTRLPLEYIMDTQTGANTNTAPPRHDDIIDNNGNGGEFEDPQYDWNIYPNSNLPLPQPLLFLLTSEGVLQVVQLQYHETDYFSQKFDITEPQDSKPQWFQRVMNVPLNPDAVRPVYLPQLLPPTTQTASSVAKPQSPAFQFNSPTTAAPAGTNVPEKQPQLQAAFQPTGFTFGKFSEKTAMDVPGGFGFAPVSTPATQLTTSAPTQPTPVKDTGNKGGFGDFVVGNAFGGPEANTAANTTNATVKDGFTNSETALANTIVKDAQKNAKTTQPEDTDDDEEERPWEVDVEDNNDKDDNIFAYGDFDNDLDAEIEEQDTSKGVNAATDASKAELRNLQSKLAQPFAVLTTDIEDSIVALKDSAQASKASKTQFDSLNLNKSKSVTVTDHLKLADAQKKDKGIDYLLNIINTTNSYVNDIVTSSNASYTAITDLFFENYDNTEQSGRVTLNEIVADNSDSINALTIGLGTRSTNVLNAIRNQRGVYLSLVSLIKQSKLLKSELVPNNAIKSIDLSSCYLVIYYKYLFAMKLLNFQKNLITENISNFTEFLSSNRLPTEIPSPSPYQADSSASVHKKLLFRNYAVESANNVIEQCLDYQNLTPYQPQSRSLPTNPHGGVNLNNSRLDASFLSLASPTNSSSGLNASLINTTSQRANVVQKARRRLKVGISSQTSSQIASEVIQSNRAKSRSDLVHDKFSHYGSSVHAAIQLLKKKLFAFDHQIQFLLAKLVQKKSSWTQNTAHGLKNQSQRAIHDSNNNINAQSDHLEQSLNQMERVNGLKLPLSLHATDGAVDVLFSTLLGPQITPVDQPVHLQSLLTKPVPLRKYAPVQDMAQFIKQAHFGTGVASSTVAVQKSSETTTQPTKSTPGTAPIPTSKSTTTAATAPAPKKDPPATTPAPSTGTGFSFSAPVPPATTTTPTSTPSSSGGFLAFGSTKDTKDAPSATTTSPFSFTSPTDSTAKSTSVNQPSKPASATGFAGFAPITEAKDSKDGKAASASSFSFGDAAFLPSSSTKPDSNAAFTGFGGFGQISQTDKSGSKSAVTSPAEPSKASVSDDNDDQYGKGFEDRGAGHSGGRRRNISSHDDEEVSLTPVKPLKPPTSANSPFPALSPIKPTTPASTTNTTPALTVNTDVQTQTKSPAITAPEATDKPAQDQPKAEGGSTTQSQPHSAAPTTPNPPATAEPAVKAEPFVKVESGPEKTRDEAPSAAKNAGLSFGLSLTVPPATTATATTAGTSTTKPEGSDKNLTSSFGSFSFNAPTTTAATTARTDATIATPAKPPASTGFTGFGTFNAPPALAIPSNASLTPASGSTSTALPTAPGASTFGQSFAGFSTTPNKPPAPPTSGGFGTFSSPTTAQPTGAAAMIGAGGFGSSGFGLGGFSSQPTSLGSGNSAYSNMGVGGLSGGAAQQPRPTVPAGGSAFASFASGSNTGSNGPSSFAAMSASSNGFATFAQQAPQNSGFGQAPQQQNSGFANHQTGQSSGFGQFGQSNQNQGQPGFGQNQQTQPAGFGQQQQPGFGQQQQQPQNQGGFGAFVQRSAGGFGGNTGGFGGDGGFDGGADLF